MINILPHGHFGTPPPPIEKWRAVVLANPRGELSMARAQAPNLAASMLQILS